MWTHFLNMKSPLLPSSGLKWYDSSWQKVDYQHGYYITNPNQFRLPVLSKYCAGTLNVTELSTQQWLNKTVYSTTVH